MKNYKLPIAFFLLLVSISCFSGCSDSVEYSENIETRSKLSGTNIDKSKCIMTCGTRIGGAGITERITSADSTRERSKSSSSSQDTSKKETSSPSKEL